MWLVLILTQAAELDALGHPDPETRLRAAAGLRRPEALPLLLQGLRHPDPEVRARCDDALDALSPLAWRRSDPRALALLDRRLLNPAPPDAELRSRRFLDAHSGTLRDLLRASAHYEQAVLPLADLDARVTDVEFETADGVIWAGGRRGHTLLSWIFGRLDDPQALCLLAQRLRPRQLDTLLDAPGPEAVDLLVVAYALKAPERIDPRLPARLAERLRGEVGRLAAPLSLVLRDHAAELAPALNAGAAGAGRWSRFLSAATAARADVADLDPAAFNALLRDPAPEIRAEAIRAVLARLKPEAWDPVALLEAVEAHPAARSALRDARDRRVQAAAVELLERAPEAALAVLEDCEDAALLDAAAEKLRGDPRLGRSTALLRRLTETGDDPEPRARLRELFEGEADDAGTRAAYALGGLPAGEILGTIEEALAHGRRALRERALIAARRLGARTGAGGCVAERLRSLSRTLAEEESDPRLAARFRELAEAEAFTEAIPWRLGGVRRFIVRRGCGGVHRPSGGWKPLPAPAVPLPGWN